MSTKKAIIIYGPPGSGKGTQAELVERSGNFTHFDTGRYIRNVLGSPQAKKSTILKKEKKLNDDGVLNTPSWVLKIVKEAVKKINASGSGVVFSGSPRTMYEAFGEGKTKGLLKYLSEVYGKKNIIIIELGVRDKVSAKRNLIRFMCSVCGLPRLGNSKSNRCSFCAGKYKKRKDDNPKIIITRLKQYHERTHPILRDAKKQKYEVKKVNGEKLPFEVFSSIRKAAGF